MINFNSMNDKILDIKYEADENANKVHFEGFELKYPNSELYLNFSGNGGLLIPLVDYTLDIDSALTGEPGRYNAQLIEVNDDEYCTHHSPVFKVIVRDSLDYGKELRDPRLETIYQKYNQMYLKIVELDEEVSRSEADRKEAWNNIRTQYAELVEALYNDYDSVKSELADDYQSTKQRLTKEVDDAITDAEGTIKLAGDTALTNIHEAEQISVESIAAKERNSLSNIESAEAAALIDIGRETREGVARIEEAKTNAVADGIKEIETAKADIEQKKNEALADIDNVIQPFEAEYGSIPSEVSKLSESIAENKRIDDARWKMAQGIVWDFAEDDAEAYSKAIPTGARLMDVQMIGGKSVAWNQLVETESVTITTDGTYTENNWLKPLTSVGVKRGSITESHVYYYWTNDERFACNSSQSIPRAYNVFKAVAKQSQLTTWYMSAMSTVPQGTYTVIYRMCDLTAMFGVTEITQVTDEMKQFCEAYASTHPQYNAGEIISSDVTDVVVRGKNLLDAIQPITFIKSEFIGYYPINLKRNVIYTISYTSTSVVYGSQCVVQGVTTDGRHITRKIIEDDRGKTVFYFDEDVNRIRIYTDVNAKDVYVQIEEGTTATAYTPYTETRIPIPEAIRNLDGYGWSAGDVFNEVDYEKKQYVQRVGRVDLGSLNWGMYSESNTMYTNSLTGQVTYLSKLLCASYNLGDGSTSQASMVDKTMSVNTSKFLRIKDSAYTDPYAFKQAMQGVPLYYELATPIVTDISDLLDDRMENIEVEPNGSITFEQNDTELAVPNKETYLITLKEVV